MQKIILDFTDCQPIVDVHAVIENAFKFPEPEVYGRNLDALWDCMSGLYDEPVLVEIYGFHKLYQLSEASAYMMDGILSVFDDVHEETPCFEYVVIS